MDQRTRAQAEQKGASVALTAQEILSLGAVSQKQGQRPMSISHYESQGHSVLSSKHTHLLSTEVAFHLGTTPVALFPIEAAGGILVTLSESQRFCKFAK